MDNQIENLKKLIIKFLQEEQNNYMEEKKQLRMLVIAVVLTILPTLIFAFLPGFADKYFDTFYGSLTYVGRDHFFSLSTFFILDLPYLLIPVLWGLALWFCLKVRKGTQDSKSFLNYAVLVLTVLNAVFLLYSLWFVYGLFLL